jgi:acyl-CoA thioester hydrolase
MARYLETFRGVVYPWHCDQMGHLNVQHYVGMYDQASVHLFAAFGLSHAHVRETNMGFADVRHVIEYKNELDAGTAVRMESRIAAVGNSSVRHEHRLLDIDSDEVAATFEVVSVYFDLRARKSAPLPQEFRERAVAMIGEGE